MQNYISNRLIYELDKYSWCENKEVVTFLVTLRIISMLIYDTKSYFTKRQNYHYLSKEFFPLNWERMTYNLSERI